MRVFWLALSVLVFLSAPAYAAKRALVIGNNAYEGGAISVLERAVNDAEAYAKVLREDRGFEVMLVKDAGRDQMLSALATFVSGIQPGDVAMFVFSGHALQLDPNRRDQLYLLPVDLTVKNYQRDMKIDLFLQFNAISFATIANQITASGAKMRVFVLDACRNPPKVGDSATRSGGLAVGIAPQKAQGEGEFIFYSAGPGEEALDRLRSEEPGSVGTSVFTRIFLEKFKAGVYLEDIANEVQLKVKELAATDNHVQRPYYSDGVTGYACLDETCGRENNVSAQASIEASFWSKCETSDDPRYCQAAP